MMRETKENEEVNKDMKVTKIKKGKETAAN